MPPRFVVGTAGWSLPRPVQPAFPDEGTHLQRYASHFAGAEINVSFYRPIAPSLYAVWAASTPETFRFAVKIPKTVTHGARLVGTETLLDDVLVETSALGEQLGPLLVQLPPSLQYDAAVARTFLAALRARHDGAIVVEPRHASWFTPAVARVLEVHRVGRVGADPARVPEAALPGGDMSVVYHRLHGSPRVYYSRYDDGYLDALAGRMRADARRADAVWCMFDNTASGAAAENALALHERLR